MIYLSFLLILSGLTMVTAGVLMFTLNITKTGQWPGLRPSKWDDKIKQIATITGGGLTVTVAGILAGYGI